MQVEVEVKEPFIHLLLVFLLGLRSEHTIFLFLYLFISLILASVFIHCPYCSFFFLFFLYFLSSFVSLFNFLLVFFSCLFSVFLGFFFLDLLSVLILFAIASLRQLAFYTFGVESFPFFLLLYLSFTI